MTFANQDAAPKAEDRLLTDAEMSAAINNAPPAQAITWRVAYAQNAKTAADMQPEIDKANEYYEASAEEARKLLGVAIDLRAKGQALADAFKLESDALFDVINGVKKELKSRDWLLEGRGPYRYDDDRYREEAGLAFDVVRGIVEAAVKPGRERYEAALADWNG